MTDEVPADPTLADWQRLVGGTIAAYWAPLQTADDGTPIPRPELADETDFGQADHILARLLEAGVHLPGVAANELAWLNTLDLRDERRDPSDDPYLSLTVLLPRSAVFRLSEAVATGHGSNLATLARTLLLQGLDRLDPIPTSHATHDTEESK